MWQHFLRKGEKIIIKIIKNSRTFVTEELFYPASRFSGRRRLTMGDVSGRRNEAELGRVLTPPLSHLPFVQL